MFVTVHLKFFVQSRFELQKARWLGGGWEGEWDENSPIGELLGFCTEGNMKRQISNDLEGQEDTANSQPEGCEPVLRSFPDDGSCW